MTSLRTKRLSASKGHTAWQTAQGGIFSEPIERVESRANEVSFTVTISRADYKLLEVLQDNVSAYASRLLTSHVQGLIKSNKRNSERKATQNGNVEQG